MQFETLVKELIAVSSGRERGDVVALRERVIRMYRNDCLKPRLQAPGRVLRRAAQPVQTAETKEVVAVLRKHGVKVKLGEFDGVKNKITPATAIGLTGN